jgi:tetratricopeptide (TPR) repeat protein
LENNEEPALEISTQLWQKILALDLNERIFDSLTVLSTAYGMENFVFMNWLGDYQMVLANAMYQDRGMAQTLMDFIDESLKRFPRIIEENRAAFLASKGDALFLLNRMEEGNALFDALQQQYSDDAWPWIWWGDQFNPAFRWAHADGSRAEELYQRAQTVEPEGQAVSQRLHDLAEWRQSHS